MSNMSMSDLLLIWSEITRYLAEKDISSGYSEDPALMTPHISANFRYMNLTFSYKLGLRQSLYENFNSRQVLWFCSWLFHMSYFIYSNSRFKSWLGIFKRKHVHLLTTLMCRWVGNDRCMWRRGIVFVSLQWQELHTTWGRMVGVLKNISFIFLA